MVEIHAKIREWLITQPNWLQEAAVRLLAKDELDQGDILQVSDLLKTGRTSAPNNQYEGFLQKFAPSSKPDQTVQM